MSKNLETQGHIHQILDTRIVSSTFRVREFVLLRDRDSQYPQTVIFQVVNDACEDINKLVVGDEIEVEFELRGREWTNRNGEIKFFNSLHVWRWKMLSPAQTTESSDATPAAADVGVAPPADDDIPF